MPRAKIPRYYTDGACRGNGSPNASGGCAYYVNEDCLKSWPDPTSPSTNQSAELGAIYGAIRKAWKYGDQSILICTDSKYCINCLTVWPDTCWKARADKDGVWLNARGTPVANQKLIKKILKNMKNVKVRMESVRLKV